MFRLMFRLMFRVEETLSLFWKSFKLNIKIKTNDLFFINYLFIVG